MRKRRNSVVWALLSIWPSRFFLAVLVYTNRPYIAMLYTTDPVIIEKVVGFLFYAIFFQLFDATAAPIQGILRGYKDVKATFYSGFFCLLGGLSALGLFPGFCNGAWSCRILAEPGYRLVFLGGFLNAADVLAAEKAGT